MAAFWRMFDILRLSGRPSSLHESNQPPLALFDFDLIPLQHLVEGGTNVGTASSAVEDSQVDLGEVTVGPLPKVTSNRLQYLLHIHRTIPPVLGVFCADLSNTNVEEYLDSLTPHKAGWRRGRLGDEDRGPLLHAGNELTVCHTLLSSQVPTQTVRHSSVRIY
jgi:hypothetical protein